MTTRDYFVYILANGSRMLYVGVTSDLKRRVYEHRSKLIPGYTRQYNISRLVFFEITPNVSAAIAREKQIKGWRRAKKLALIETQNPTWSDLSAGWKAPAFCTTHPHGGADRDSPVSRKGNWKVL